MSLDHSGLPGSIAGLLLVGCAQPVTLGAQLGHAVEVVLAGLVDAVGRVLPVGEATGARHATPSNADWKRSSQDEHRSPDLLALPSSAFFAGSAPQPHVLRCSGMSARLAI